MDCLAGVSVAGKITPNTWKHIEKNIHILFIQEFCLGFDLFFPKADRLKNITVSAKPSFFLGGDSWCFRICEEQPGISWFIGVCFRMAIEHNQHNIGSKASTSGVNVSTLESLNAPKYHWLYMYTQGISPWKWEVSLYCCNLFICGISYGVLRISINMIF